MRERGVDFDAIEYLKNPLGADDLARFLDLLDIPPGELVRKDKNFKELGLDAAKYSETARREVVIDLLLEHPKLMQRPIAVREGRAVIGRPSDRVLELLDD